MVSTQLRLGSVLIVNFLAGAASKSLSNLKDDCKFTLDKKAYDLCSLFNQESSSEWTIGMDNDTPPTITKYVYRIALAGPLKKDDSMPDNDQCPHGTWVCMTATNRRPSHESETPRIIQLIPVAGNVARDSNHSSTVNVTAHHNIKNDVDILEIRLHGGNYVKQRQEAHIQFFCDKDVHEPSSPSFAWSWNGSHTFSWTTRHACSNSTKNPVDKPPDDTEDSDDPPKDEEPEEPEKPDNKDQKLLDPSSSLSWSSTIAFMFTLPGVLLIVYLICAPHLVKNWVRARFIKSRRSQLPFRVGESLLIRWAEEDMGIEGEEDVMVNHRDGWQSEEEIPLRRSPSKFSNGWINYGSAKN